MSIEIAEFLHACGEIEMADAVENMHNRLEAFSDGLDRDCIDAAGQAVEVLTKQRDELLSLVKKIKEWDISDFALAIPVGLREEMQRLICEAKGGA